MEENSKVQAESIAREQRPPIVETKIGRSKDGRWIIHKTIITDIKPVGYYRQVLKAGE